MSLCTHIPPKKEQTGTLRTVRHTSPPAGTLRTALCTPSPLVNPAFSLKRSLHPLLTPSPPLSHQPNPILSPQLTSRIVVLVRHTPRRPLRATAPAAVSPPLFFNYLHRPLRSHSLSSASIFFWGGAPLSTPHTPFSFLVFSSPLFPSDQHILRRTTPHHRPAHPRRPLIASSAATLIPGPVARLLPPEMRPLPASLPPLRSPHSF